MWLCFVEVIRPGPDHGTGMRHLSEHGFVQEFIAQAPVETLDKAFRHGLAGDDVVPSDLAFRDEG